jgi:hypothetical protein
MLTFLKHMFGVLNKPCREHAGLISATLDGRAPRGVRVGLRLHYVLCAPCRALNRQWRFLQRAARRMSPESQARVLGHEPMPAEVRERLRRACGTR